ncbi:thiol reductant ABC exporter subunit CydC [Rugosimonospora acidiphila]|uniref:Thiol reductant ABC exporter subunit CydC n=1 Tax=Rugosimonospora acidiphila TaxID=556531 RepID=A0ABP9RNQ2_9ACTN
MTRPAGTGAPGARFAGARLVARGGGIWQLLLAALLSAATDLSGLGLLATATWLISRAAQRPPIVALTVAIVAVRGLAVAKGTLRYVERLAGHDAALRVLARLRTRVYATASRGTDPLPRGDLLARLVSDVDSVQDLLLRCAIPAGVGGIVALVTVGFTAAFSGRAALLLLAGLLVAGLALPALAYLLASRAAARIAQVRGRYLAASVDVLAGAADLAAFGATEAALADAAGQSSALARLERRAGVAGAVTGAVGALVPGATAIGVLALSVRGGPSVMVAVLSLLALAAVEAVLPLLGAAVRYAELRGAWQRVRPLLLAGDELPGESGSAEPGAGEPGSAEPGAGEPSAIVAPPAIVARQLTVRYPGGPVPALDGVDLELPPGRRVAVVGPSGAGKSTLLGVLTGAVQPTAGRLSVSGAAPDGATPDGATPDGGPVRVGPSEGGAAEGREALGWPRSGGVLADGYVFHASVRENLTLGRAGFDDAALGRALAVAGLADWAQRLDELVGEDGAQVSGGQRQRLLLARALLDPPPVLVLDEPTEGLDPEAADAVLADVLRAADGHTVVMVTHRLVDLRAFDEIVVLIDGRISQRGPHDALVEGPGWYSTWAGIREVPESTFASGMGR